MDDLDNLHALACLSPVYRYLFDGEAPERRLIEEWIERGTADRASTSGGLWLLQGDGPGLVGCVQVRPDLPRRCAELSYLLDPAFQGTGLATRMGWTAIAQAFLSPAIDFVFAGADQPNSASFAVMRRLGMQFRRNVRYPLGDGKEYVLYRSDTGPSPRPEPLPIIER